MTFEIGVVLIILTIAVILFATELLSVDLVALIVMSTLLLTGIITPGEGISGFSNTATVTVGAMFVLSAGLFKTGAVNFAGRLLGYVGKRSFWSAAVLIMVAIAFISAFINNTAAVAIFLPIVLGLARDMNVSPSKLLMPLSFASMFGGVCTLIGTSTNILVSSIAEKRGQPPFAMFEFAPFGLIIVAAGFVYMLLVGIRLIPERRGADDLAESFGLGEYLTDLVLSDESESVGKSLAESLLIKEHQIAVLDVFRNGHRLAVPPPSTVLRAGDVLRVRTDVKKLMELQDLIGISIKPGMKWREEDLRSEDAVLVEAVVALNSPLERKTLVEAKFRNTFGATVMAIRHRGELLLDNIVDTPLRAGDALLVEVKRDHLEQLRQSPAFLIVSEVALPDFRRNKIIPAALIMAAVIVTATTGALPIVVSAIVGSVALVLAGCLTIDEAYEAIDWRIIFLLAGVLTLGIALENSGAAKLISEWMIGSVGAYGPVALVSGLFFLTMMLTNVMSNNASAAVLAPIAIVTAESLTLNPRPFLMAVTFAASLSFMTPVGYQTNTLIYGPGQYRFADFTIVGTPLNLIFWILATVFIPIIWPF